MNFPAKFKNRVNEKLKTMQKLVQTLDERQVDESNTVRCITQILEVIMGYDPYMDITSEFAIKKAFNNAYCDLAIKGKNGKVRIILEAKGITIELNEKHLKQAMDYGADTSIRWVILTNLKTWKLYKLTDTRPIDKELIYEFNFMDLNPKNEQDLTNLFIISKEGEEQDSLDEYYAQKQIKNKYMIGAFLASEDVYYLIRRNVKRLFDDVKISTEEIENIIKNEIVLKEVLNSDDAVQTRKEIAKAQKKLEKIGSKEKTQKKESKSEIINDSEINDGKNESPERDAPPL
ncbi:MAG: type I restriction enzyme HsdR N-terminal domain-containing protein [Proteobacteria bacterium]|nr:type I restriction enzyme HsdR N-terminal domain-containing protein [Pseudomonadota bacterium]